MPQLLVGWPRIFFSTVTVLIGSVSVTPGYADEQKPASSISPTTQPTAMAVPGPDDLKFIPPTPDLTSPITALIEFRIAFTGLDTARIRAVTLMKGGTEKYYRLLQENTEAELKMYKAIDTQKMQRTSVGPISLLHSKFYWNTVFKNANAWVTSLNIKVDGDKAEAFANKADAKPIQTIRKIKGEWKVEFELKVAEGESGKKECDLLNARTKAITGTLLPDIQSGKFKSESEVMDLLEKVRP